jgi:hypothetical protein
MLRLPSLSQEGEGMQGVIVEFRYTDDFDRARIEGIAHEARGRFEGLPGLRQKAFTLDEQNRLATNVYLWESDAAARQFFTDELVERITGLYGVRPTVRFVEVAEFVDNE